LAFPSLTSTATASVDKIGFQQTEHLRVGGVVVCPSGPALCFKMEPFVEVVSSDNGFP